MWFYARNGQSVGPVPFEELRRMATAGQLGPADLVLQAGSDRWQSATSVPGLIDAPLAVPADDGGSTRPSIWVRAWEAVRRHLSRATAWDLRNVAVSPGERDTLAAAGVAEPGLQRYLAWRRSVLMATAFPVLLNAFLGLFDRFGEEWSAFTGMGQLWLVLGLLASLSMPATVVPALLLWTRLRASTRVINWGWAVSFLLPLGLLLIPAPWLLSLPEGPEAALGARFGFGIVVFALLCLTLPVWILGMASGVQRASLRLKTLMPESPLPGVLLVGVAPILTLVLLAPLALFVQVASSPLLFLGLGLLIASSLVYLVHGRLFIRPLFREVDINRMRSRQTLARVLLWGALLMFLAYAMTREIRVPQLSDDADAPLAGELRNLDGKTLLGFTRAGAIVPLWDWDFLRNVVLNLLSFSFLTTVLIADLLMRINLYTWYHDRERARSDGAQEYEERMARLRQVLGRH